MTYRFETKFFFNRNFFVKKITGTLVEVAITLVLTSFVGKTVQEVDVRKNFNLNIVTIVRKRIKKNLLGINKVIYVSEGVVKPDTIFEEGDILVVFGTNPEIKSLADTHDVGREGGY